MWQFEHSVNCNVKKSFVWSFWTEVSNWERIEGKAVEWIKLHGPFTVGTSGTTKLSGQAPRHWEISQLDPEYSATIKMQLAGAEFYNAMSFESASPNQTLIIQHLSLRGPKASEFTEGMKMFESTAPQGLVKLAKVIEEAYEDSNS